MRLYKMELKKIIGRRFTQMMTGLLLLALGLQIWVEVRVAAGWAAEGINDFGQNLGYKRFLDLAQVFVLYTMVWMIAVLSAFYCEDVQNGTDVLILTSVKGKFSDFTVRLAVTWTLSAAALFAALGAAYGGCYVLYGYSDGSAPAKEICLGMDETAAVLAEGSIRVFIGYYLIRVLCAVLMLAGIIVWISAASRKTMYALIAVSVIFWCPIMLESGGNPSGIMAVQPAWLITIRCMHENWLLYEWHIFLALLVAAMGSICGGRRWCLPRK